MSCQQTGTAQRGSIGLPIRAACRTKGRAGIQDMALRKESVGAHKWNPWCGWIVLPKERVPACKYGTDPLEPLWLTQWTFVLLQPEIANPRPDMPVSRP